MTRLEKKVNAFMGLDNSTHRRQQDPQGMLDLVLRFPELCTEAWTLGADAVLPSLRPTAIVTVGMGGSGIGGDLLRAVLFDEVAIPAVVVKDYRMPGFVGARTLVFVCSYSGDTEETLTAYDDAIRRKAACVVITSGEGLLRRAREHGHPTISIPGHLPQPRTALPFLFLPMLAVLTRLGVVDSFDAQVDEAIEILTQIRNEQGPDRSGSTCQRLAQVLLHRIPVIYSATPFLEPVAQRWKDQMNENAKTFAVWNTFPELNHNETVGWELDAPLARSLYVIILHDRAEPARLARRVAITRELAFTKGAGIEDVRAVGEGKLARLLSLIMMGDLVSCYLAVLRGVDPTPVRVIEELKRRLTRNE